MNKLVIVTILVIAVALTEGQGLRRRGGGGGAAQRVLTARAGEGGALSESALQAEERSLDALKALLQKKNAKQVRLAKKAERKEKKKQAQRAAEGERLAAESAVDYETYDKAEDFHNLEASANKNIENKFALQIASDNKHQENAAIRENSGSKASSGTKFKAEEAIDTEVFANQEDLFDSEFFDNNEINAEETAEDILNAEEETRAENEASINTRNFDQRGSGFEDSFFNDDNSGFGLGASSGFGGSRFGGFGSLSKRN